MSSRIARLFLLGVFAMNASAAETGTVSGTLTIGEQSHRLAHVLVIPQPGTAGALWIYLTDVALPPATARDPAKLSTAVGTGALHGLRLAVDPEDPRQPVKGTLFLPVPDGYRSMPEFWEPESDAGAETSPPWLTVAGAQVSGNLQFGLQAGMLSSGNREFADTPDWFLEVEFAAAVTAGGEGGKANAEARLLAQQSPQAEVLLAYEDALLRQGIDAAVPYMTAEKLADMRSLVEQFGADGFRQFQEHRRAGTPQGEARRGQIETLVVDEGRAVLTLRTGPHEIDEVRLALTKGAWKIDR
ncbi:MAG: hypothetical protein AB7Q97_05530 [Gammaproteobacteria bacterium]